MTFPSEPLIGISGYIDQTQANVLISSLTDAWIITMRKAPGELSEDLQLCRRWFDPVAQGQRLRKDLAELDEFPTGLDNPGIPFALRVGTKKWLVTPEGRCALDLLQSLHTDRPVWIIDDARTAYYDRVLAHLYRDWSRHRLNSVVALLSGTTKPLQIPAAGVVIALMVNGNHDRATALVRFASDGPRELVDIAFFTAVNAFADILAPGRRGNRNSKLISGWMLYEARRRLGPGLVVEDFHGSRDGKVWVPAEHEAQTIDVIGRDLARGHRPKVTATRFSSAFDALVEELRSQLPRLAGFGLSHEQPTETRRLRNALTESVSQHLEL